MPLNKNAVLRFRIIDACLTHRQRPYPTMEQIIEKIEAQLGQSISESLFTKDLAQMKKIYGAPIKYNRFHKGYYYDQEGFSIKEFPLTHEEIEALDYSTALLHQLKGTKIFEQFENAINKDAFFFPLGFNNAYWFSTYKKNIICWSHGRGIFANGNAFASGKIK